MTRLSKRKNAQSGERKNDSIPKFQYKCESPGNILNPPNSFANANGPSHEQDIIDVIAETFSPELKNEVALTTTLQSIKGLLFDRDFLGVFENQSLVPTYCARYMPSRALAYADLLKNIEQITSKLNTCEPVRALILGGGAGPELIALAHTRGLSGPLTIDVADLGAYGDVLTRLHLSSKSLCPDVTLNFHRADLLDPLKLSTLQIENADLITMCYVFNELCSMNKIGAIHLLSQLRNRMTPGALLLVVDAMSFSEISIGNSKHSISVFLDRLPGLKRVAGTDSQWYRVPTPMKYPLKLENMRFFYRLYQVEAIKGP
jgi:25S rRNA (uracil2843-N3)-methyltransferase